MAAATRSSARIAAAAAANSSSSAVASSVPAPPPPIVVRATSTKRKAVGEPGIIIDENKSTPRLLKKLKASTIKQESVSPPSRKKAAPKSRKGNVKMEPVMFPGLSANPKSTKGGNKTAREKSVLVPVVPAAAVVPVLSHGRSTRAATKEALAAGSVPLFAILPETLPAVDASPLVGHYSNCVTLVLARGKKRKTPMDEEVSVPAPSPPAKRFSRVAKGKWREGDDDAAEEAENADNLSPNSHLAADESGEKNAGRTASAESPVHGAQLAPPPASAGPGMVPGSLQLDTAAAKTSLEPDPYPFKLPKSPKFERGGNDTVTRYVFNPADLAVMPPPEGPEQSRLPHDAHFPNRFAGEVPGWYLKDSLATNSEYQYNAVSKKWGFVDLKYQPKGIKKWGAKYKKPE